MRAGALPTAPRDGAHATRPIGYIYATVGGAPQTTARATLTGLQFVLAHTVGHLRIFPDLKNIVQGVNNFHKVREREHAELWLNIKQLVETREEGITIQKTDAHRTWKHFASLSTVERVHFAGNFFADALADKAAKLAELPAEVVEPILHRYRQQEQNLDRIIAVMNWHLDHKAPCGYTDKPGREMHKSSFQPLQLHTDHSMPTLPWRLPHVKWTHACARCGQMANRATIQIFF